MQLIHIFWKEVGSELVLLLLFCTGFVLFRLSSVRELIPGGRLARHGKVLKDPSALPSTPTAGAAPSAPATPLGGGMPASRRASLVQRGSSRQEQPRPSPSPTAAVAHELRVRAALEGNDAEAAVLALAEMALAGLGASGGLISAVIDFAARQGEAAAQVLHRLPIGALSADAAGVLLQRAAADLDVDLIREVCRCIAGLSMMLPAAACEAVLKACASAGDGGAVDAFEELIQAGFEPQESLLTALVSLCADSKHVLLAERAVAFSRKAHGRVLLPLYAALMKVYGHARLWHKTCDLYEAIKKEGVALDTVAYGALIKAAVESGRHDLARELFQESGNPDLLNYMSLIRAAGRERDLPKALRLLEELERSPISADATTYNCALEACATCNDRAAAESLFQRMSQSGQIDVVSYNTYLKILLSTGAHPQASAILREMSSRGFPPNAVTYNSLIRDAVSRQDVERAWSIVQAMERANVRPDAFTCSILMKGVKHSPAVGDVDRIVAMIERERIVPDEVLLNCLLDACVRLRDPQRLTHVLEQFKATGVVPSLHAYATLIRAYGHAHRCDRAWELWHELQNGGRSLATSQHEEVFAAMVEACLAGGDLRGGLAVFRDAREQLGAFPRSATIFAACVKACMQSKQAPLALELYADTKEHFICGKITFNTLIDILVRQGDMARAGDLFRDMALKNVTPDLITYSTLIKGHCSRGDLEQGLQLLGLMHRRGIKPDAVLFNSILDGCAHKQMRTLTEQVLRDMEAAGIAPSNFTISILVKLYGRCGDLDAAISVVETYPKRYGFPVNAQVFTCLMSACIANGALPKAVEVYNAMESRGCTPDAKTYQTLLSGCLRASDLQRAAQTLQDSLRSGCAPRLDGDVVDAALLLLVRRGLAGEAAPLMDELLRQGVRLSDRAIGAVRRAGATGDAGSLIGDTPRIPDGDMETPMTRRRSSFGSDGERPMGRFGSLGSSDGLAASRSGDLAQRPRREGRTPIGAAPRRGGGRA